MPSDDRDRFFEKALARHIQADSAESGALCLDVETLAAYHERMLSPDEMAEAKAHLITCARCQSILAELERTQDTVEEEAGRTLLRAMSVREVVAPMGPEEAAELAAMAAEPGAAGEDAANANAPENVKQFPVKRRLAMRWGLPVGAIAAAVLIFWIAGWERERMSKVAPAQVASNRDYEGARSSSPAQTAPEAQSHERAREEALQRMAKDEKGATQLRTPPAARTGDAALPMPRLAQPPRAKKEQLPSDQLTADSSMPSAKAAEASQNTGGAGVAPQTNSGADNAPVYATRGDTAERDSASKQTDKLKSLGKIAAANAAPAPVPAKPSSANGVGLAGALTASRDSKTALERVNLSDAAIRVAAPDGKNVWRFGASGLVAFSSDGGTTWTPQVSGVTTGLVAGAAPSANVCWIAGNSGTLLRTSDAGKHWQVVATPDAKDLATISASNDKQATICYAAGGACYETKDRGVTWTPKTP